MMKQRETGIYTNDFLEFIGSGHSTVPKGGFVIIVMRHEHLQTVPSYKDKLEPYMDQLEADGKWKKVERRTVPNYFCDKEGLVFVFRITKPE
ncbi:uncharacterized protein LOC127002509 isoform X4 [Eriocheir sinensis]|nr:uncharacterized protein LOC127002509 isoform X3 [Eriocheir sinensis]XP_050724521.1 uncharacterized protein LOC127002509 isoform X4 [Eriocheir sinensis]